MHPKLFAKPFLTVGILIVLLAAPGYLFAGTIVTVHGHAGKIEFMDRILSAPPYYRGWGLEFAQSPSGPNYVHYSVPVPLMSKTRYVAVVFKTDSVNAVITAIDVFNGETQIFRKDGLKLSGNKQWYILDMQHTRTIDEALGISIEVRAGVEAMSTKVTFYSVAAMWEP